MSQQTDQKIIIEEEKFIRGLLNLGENDKFEFNDRGWTSRVYIINSGEFVFKFPREEKVKEEYKLEIPAYKTAYTTRGDVLIPEVQWEHPNMDYMGYRGIKGQPMYKAIKTLGTAEKQKIGSDLGTFLKKFHASHIKNVPLMSQEKQFDEYKYKLELGMPAIKEHLNASEVEQLQQFVFKEYPEKMREFGFKKGLCHGDLGYWNMIYSEDGKVGVIDFGDVGYYDTSIDFAGMNDKEILDSALKAYGGDVIREKIELRMKIIPVIDMPFFVGKEDEKGIKETIERMRKITLA